MRIKKRPARERVFPKVQSAVSKTRKAAIALLALYVLFILWKTVFSRTPDETLSYTRPLWKFYSYHFLIYGFTDIVPNIVLNILFFVPFGFLLAAAIGGEGWKTFALTVLPALALSVAIEFTQLYFKLGKFELDDIVNNTLGAALGFLIYKFVYRKIKCAK